MISFLTTITIIVFTTIIAGFVGLNARQWLGKPTPLELKLGLELEKTQKELSGYQHDVNTHFRKTAELFNNMSRQYKTLYEHLAASSKHLCNPESRIPTLETHVSANKIEWKDTDLASLDHNWHPTFFEARDTIDQNIDQDSDLNSNLDLDLDVDLNSDKKINLSQGLNLGLNATNTQADSDDLDSSITRFIKKFNRNKQPSHKNDGIVDQSDRYKNRYKSKEPELESEQID